MIEAEKAWNERDRGRVGVGRGQAAAVPARTPACSIASWTKRTFCNAESDKTSASWLVASCDNCAGMRARSHCYIQVHSNDRL
jgi:hypothetical protein